MTTSTVPGRGCVTHPWPTREESVPVAGCDGRVLREGSGVRARGPKVVRVFRGRRWKCPVGTEPLGVVRWQVGVRRAIVLRSLEESDELEMAWYHVLSGQWFQFN